MCHASRQFEQDFFFHLSQQVKLARANDGVEFVIGGFHGRRVGLVLGIEHLEAGPQIDWHLHGLTAAVAIARQLRLRRQIQGPAAARCALLVVHAGKGLDTAGGLPAHGRRLLCGFTAQARQIANQAFAVLRAAFLAETEQIDPDRHGRQHSRSLAFGVCRTVSDAPPHSYYRPPGAASARSHSLQLCKPTMNPTLVLASTSRYRRELLARAGLRFEVLAPQVDEAPLAGETPAALALRLAQAKAQAGLASALASAAPGSRLFVIGSDQVIDHAGQPVGKPGTAQRAVAQLAAMRGAALTVFTGVAVASNVAALQAALDEVRVQLRDYSDAEIERYVAAERPLDCAGAIKSEALGQHLIERIESADPSSLIGLPVLTVLAMLRRAGVDTLALATGAAHA